MSSGSYSVFCLRYYPDMVTGEFVNVGVAVVAVNGWWSVRVAHGLRDLQCLFPSAQPNTLRSLLTHMERRLGPNRGGLILEPAAEDDPLGAIRRRLGSLNGSLRWSEPVFNGTAPDLVTEVDYWFESLVQAARLPSFAEQAVASAGHGEQGLRALMEQEFVRRGVIARLSPVRIEGYYSTRFRYTYRNAALNVFEPIRLNFKQGPPVLRRAEQWRGRLDILGEEVDGPLAFFALVDLAPDPRLEYETQTALTMIQRAHVSRVETVPVDQIERFGQLVLDVVGGTE